MDRYAAENARAQIDGYMILERRGESHEEYFERAKAECLKHHRQALENIESMDYGTFIAAAKFKNALNSIPA